MKKLTAKLRSKSFWVAVAGALTLILSRLGYADAATLAQNVIDGIAGVLLLLGIAVSPFGENDNGKRPADPANGDADDAPDKCVGEEEKEE